MILRNRTRRALFRFVSALFADVPAVLARTSSAAAALKARSRAPSPSNAMATDRESSASASSVVLQPVPALEVVTRLVSVAPRLVAQSCGSRGTCASLG